MQDYLKHYNLRITALSPIHVGSGCKLGKKEYIQLGTQKPVIVPDINKMFQDLHSMHRDRAYAEFMLNGKTGLGQWILEQRIPEKSIDNWKRYSMEPGDAFVRQNNSRNAATPKEIMTFTKDVYEKPYVPGSTIKGMFRNAVLCYRVYQNPSKFQRKMNDLVEASRCEAKKDIYLAKETKAIETAVFNTLGRDKENTSNAVNSVMSGLVVSDSRPIEEKQLMLAQKIDYTLNGEEKSLPILREALKPGTQIDFELTIDTRSCDITIEELIAALDYFNQVSNQYFYSKFKRGNRNAGTVWLGGGTGFLSKTMLYPLYGDRAVRITDSVFRVTIKNYIIHKHNRDVGNGVAPHVCKCTRYKGKLYDMGMGKIEVLN